MATQRRTAILVALAFLFLEGRESSALPIRTTDPNVGVFSGSAALGRVEFVKASRPGVDVSATIVPAALLYSPTTYSAFGIVAPYVEKRLKLKGQGEESTRGLSDILLLGRYKFFSLPQRGVWNQAAFQFTLKLPTGPTNRRVNLPVPPSVKRALQPGTGSTDFVFELTGGRFTTRYNLLANFGYRLNTEDDNIAFGDRFFVNWDMEYFLFPRLTRKHGQEVISLLEWSFIHTERDRFRNKGVPNSGGNSLFLAPGLQWIVSERFLVEASVQFPLFQNLRGKRPKLEHSVLIGFRFVY
jgi:hypothetical protein